MNDIQGVLNLLLSITEGAKFSFVLGSSWVQNAQGNGLILFYFSFLASRFPALLCLGNPLSSQLQLPGFRFPDCRVESVILLSMVLQVIFGRQGANFH